MTAPPEMASLGRCCLFLPPRSERPSVIIYVRKRSFNFWQMGVSERGFFSFLGRPSRCCPQFFVPLFLFFPLWQQEKRGKNGRQLGGGGDKKCSGEAKKKKPPSAPKSIFLFPFSFREKEKENRAEEMDTAEKDNLLAFFSFCKK